MREAALAGAHPSSSTVPGTGAERLQPKEAEEGLRRVGGARGPLIARRLVLVLKRRLQEDCAAWA